MRAALVLSILAHSAAFFVVRPLAARLVGDPPAAPLEDRWTGTSIEVSLGGPGSLAAAPGGELADSTGATQPSPGAASAGAAPSPSTSAAPEPSGAPRTPAPLDKPSASRDKAPPDKAPPAHDKPSRKKAAPRDDKASPDKAPPGKHKPPRDKGSGNKPRFSLPTRQKGSRPPKPPVAPAASGSAAPVASAAGSAVPGDGAGTAGTFGSEGAASVRDLGRAFTRAIPAACSADPVWGKASSGDTFTLTALVHVDAAGHVTGAEPVGADPPKALVNVLSRTVPILQGGTFAVSGGAVTAGTETIELHAVVSDKAAGEAEGAKAELEFKYDAATKRGKASFTQTGGRHVDITVHLV